MGDGDDGRLQKMEIDYSSAVEEKLKSSESLVKGGKLNEAIEGLLVLEKQTRTGADMHSTSKILVAIITMCYECKKWDTMSDNIYLLTKRRGQLKQAVTKMVQHAMTYLDSTPNLEVKLKLIDTLRAVTAGKIYVEIERARLTKLLASIREDQGDITEAANIMQELQVETFGSMEKREKVEFILEQMRLCLAKKDFIRTQIISKKIAVKFFDEKDTNELKLKYYQLMIELDQHEGSYLSICNHFKAVYDTASVQEVEQKKIEALKCVVLYLILAAYDNEQSDFMHRLKDDKNLEHIPLYQELLKRFTTSEIMRWSEICSDFEAELRSSAGDDSSLVFSSKAPEGEKRWADLKHRVVEHNIRVMSKYYSRVRTKRMATLLDLSQQDTEDFLSQLVVKKTVNAKIDRLDGIVTFKKALDPAEILNDWSYNVTQLMNIVNKTTHLITKEEMVYKLH